MTWYDTHTAFKPGQNPYDIADSGAKSSGKFIPYAGLIYDFVRNYSAYASYATIYYPQSATDHLAHVLAPLEGEQYEAGIKAEYLDGRLNASLAVFQLTEANRAIDDPRYPGMGYSVATGKARARGVEMTATGSITANWSLSGGYTYTHTRYLDASTNADGVGFNTIAPSHLFKLWTQYRLPGRLNRITFGAGANATSATAATDGVGTVRQGGYATFDLRASYALNEHLSASVNASNITDKTYYRIDSVGSVFYSDPRQLIFTLRAKY